MGCSTMGFGAGGGGKPLASYRTEPRVRQSLKDLVAQLIPGDAHLRRMHGEKPGGGPALSSSPIHQVNPSHQEQYPDGLAEEREAS